MELEVLGQDELGRDVFFASIAAPAAVRDLSWPPTHFVVLLVWNAAGVPTESVSLVVDELFSHGASYICTWGTDCERVHDIADETDCYPSDLASPDDAVRMSTWHADEELDEAVAFFLRDTQPDAFYAPMTACSLLLCVGRDELAMEARRSLARVQVGLDE